MQVGYDPEADALYIEIKATTATTKRLDEDVATQSQAADHYNRGSTLGLYA